MSYVILFSLGNIPYEHGLKAMLRFLGDELENENCVEGVLEWIAKTHCRDGASTDPLLPLHIWRIFLVHQENPRIIQHGLTIMIHCTSIGEMRFESPRLITPEAGNDDPASAEFYDTLIDNSTCWNEKGLAFVCNLANKHLIYPEVHLNILVLLEAVLCPLQLTDLELDSQIAYWSKYVTIFRSLCEMDYPQIIIKALMRVHEGHANLLRIALAVMWKLCIHRELERKKNY